MLERNSALGAHLGGEPILGVDRRTGLELGEVRGWSLVQVAGFAANGQDVARAIGDLAGVGAPTRADRPAVGADAAIFKTGHRQYWIVGPERTDFLARASAALDGSTAAVTDLSQSRTRMFIDGAAAATVLKKGIALDFADATFPLGAAALTGVHHTPILLHRVAATRYEIYAMRTFAVAVWEWLTDASLEYGYRVAAA